MLVAAIRGISLARKARCRQPDPKINRSWSIKHQNGMSGEPKISGNGHHRRASIVQSCACAITTSFNFRVYLCHFTLPPFPDSYIALSQCVSKMFRRQLLRQSRAISESLSSLQQVRRSPFSSATFVSPCATLPASYASRIGRRWQSSEAENKPAETPASSSEESKPAETQEDPSKQELEKAKKEILELKVC